MKPEFLVVCDFVSMDAAGKMVIVGTFDRFFAPQVPFAAPTMGIAVKLRCESGDQAGVSHALEVRIKAPDGNVLAKMDGKLGVNAPVPGDTMDMNSVQMPIMLNGFTFPSLGKYTVELWLDKKLVHTSPIYVVKQPQGKSQ